jgi:hypothetical protein
MSGVGAATGQTRCRSETKIAGRKQNGENIIN